MNRNSFLKQLLLGLSIAVFFTSCDKDYNVIGTNVIGDDHFGFNKYTGASIKAYNQKLGPVASSNLDVNALGIYFNPAFGKTTANFVTQLEMASGSPSSVNPTFTTITNPPVIDSVILKVPYLSTLTQVNNDGTKTYTLNSKYGQDLSKFRLSIFESGYYLRDLDPLLQLGEQQLNYTDKNAEIDSYKMGVRLNNSSTAVSENDQFFFDPSEIKENIPNTDGVVQLTRSAPAMRIHLRTDFFTQKILNATSGQLYNNNIFKNYFRGLYFKVENPDGNPGNMVMLNFKKGTITVYYKGDIQIAATTTVPAHVDRVNKTWMLNMTGNTVNMLDNTNETTQYTTAINTPNAALGDEKLYLKGGEGSIAVIDLFGTTDLKGIDPTTGLLNNIPNGVSDELDEIKVNKWLINEANLTFYIDKTSMFDTQIIEPERIFLYDLKNKVPLIDYYYDASTNSTDPNLNKTIFGGIIEKETATNGRGIKYKIKITNHLRNLIMKDSTNVRLGLSVTQNINDFSMSKLKTPNATTDKAPKMSVLNPLGTILYGTNPNVVDENKLKLEIYYTKPD